MSRCPSRFSLLEWRLGELKGAEERAVARHLAECSQCQAHRAAIDADFAEFAPREPSIWAALPTPPSFAPEGASATRRRRGGFSLRRRVGWALVGAVLGGVLISGVLSVARFKAPPAELFKGRFAVEITAKREAQQFRVVDGERLRAGDRLRFVVTGARPGFVSVFSVDRTYVVSSFYPDGAAGAASQALPLPAAGRVVLPESIALDASRGEERIFAVYSERPFSSAAVQAQTRELLRRRAAVTAAAIGLDGVIHQWTIEKVP